ncbi:hypothetical protein PENTCL1PPCAC_30683 [Pristionchus entomophagus]|uniref:SXP/RAL-2 family protein Ani s 5-like cation-binding domain-containing protein n=1 Tax=Pristionchus entomophagus TaxID=358040 RepID=A0AAV5UN82_9BILA|nr:hypothetical protein PENTCL1PPCAC_30683 [Pristionchus entomophagus]
MMKAFLEQNNAGRSGLQDKILEANQKFHEVTMNMIKSRSETTAIIIGILNNVAVKSAIEKDSNNLNTKIDMMRQMISKMEDQRRRIVDWLVENDLKKTKKGFNAVLARAVPEKAETVQTHLKSMAEDSSILGSLIKDSILLISNANFDHDLIEKLRGALNFAQGKIADLFDEIATLRVAMAKSPRSVILDGIKGHLKDLDLAINSVPSMVTQTTNQFIQEQMKKLEVKDQEFINGVNNGLHYE